MHRGLIATGVISVTIRSFRVGDFAARRVKTSRPWHSQRTDGLQQIDGLKARPIW